MANTETVNRGADRGQLNRLVSCAQMALVALYGAVVLATLGWLVRMAWVAIQPELWAWIGVAAWLLIACSIIPALGWLTEAAVDWLENKRS